MFQVPITFIVDVNGDMPEKVRRWAFHEFAVNGAKHLVLSDQFIWSIIAKPDFAEQLTREIADEGLDLVDGHAIFGQDWDLNALDPDRFAQIVERKKRELRIASDMGVKTLTIHVGNSPEPYDTEEALRTQFDNIRRALGELLPTAEKCGVIIAIENIWYKISTPEALWKIKSDFDTPYLGFCFDAGHANRVAKCPGLQIPNDPDVQEKMLDGIVSCHIHDNLGLLDQHLVPGEGNIDWPKVAGLLKKAPRLTSIQCETVPLWTRSSARDICAGMRRFFGSLD